MNQTTPLFPRGILIGLMGIKRSGKDTVGDYLVSNCGFIKRAFADPLKAACRELFLLSDDQLYGDSKEVPDGRWYGASSRRILQYVGTDLLRDQLDKIMPGLGTNIHTRNFELWYNQNSGSNIIVPDVRFRNEVELIHRLGGIVVRLDRQAVITNDLHPSETELLKIDNYDYFLDNNGTKEQLITKTVPELMSQISSDRVYYNQYYVILERSVRELTT